MGAQQSTAMPQVLLLHTADSLLNDRETVAAAATSRCVHHALRSYKVKSAQSLWSVIDHDRPRGKEILSNVPVANAASTVDTSDINNRVPVEFSPWRIGRVQSVFTTNHDYNGLRRLIELPESVKTLEFERSIFSNDDKEVMDAWKELEPPPSSITFPPSLTELTFVHFAPPLELSKCILPPQLVSLNFSSLAYYLPPQITSDLVWPESLTELTGVWTDDLDDFNQWKLPPNLRTLHFTEHFDLPLDGIALPDSITDLQLGDMWCHPLEGVQLPKDLTKFSCYPASSSNYEDEEDLSLRNVKWPSGLQQIICCRNLKDLLESNTLPDSLTELSVDYEFETQSQQRFPRSLTKLDLSQTWSNQPFDDPDAFPDSLTELYLSEMFNQDLAKVHLPSQLRTLILGADFNQPMDGVVFPHSLTTLQFGAGFNHPMCAVQLPRSLTDLRFGDKFNSSVAGMKLPEGLRHLQFGEAFNQSVDKLTLPSSLTQLYMSCVFDRSIDETKLPESLTELSFNHPYRNGKWSRKNGISLFHSLVNIKLPSALTSLVLSTENQSLIGVAFPSSLTLLDLGSLYNQPLNGVILPPHLRQLNLGEIFNQSLVGVDLPSSITRLKLNDEYNQSLTGVRFPASLTSFTFQPKFYTLPLNLSSLPPSCRELELTIRPPYTNVCIPDHIEVLRVEIVNTATLEVKTKENDDDDEGATRSVNHDPLDDVDEVDDVDRVSDLTGLRFPSSLRDLTFTGNLRVSLKGAIWNDSNPKGKTDAASDCSTFTTSETSALHGSSSIKITFHDFNQPLLLNHLPESCTELNLGNEWNLSIDQLVLPPRLKQLRTGHAFNQYIDEMILPSSLQVLSFGRKFSHQIHRIKLPASLHSLEFDQGPFHSEHYITFIQSGALARSSVRHISSKSFGFYPLTLSPLPSAENVAAGEAD